MKGCSVALTAIGKAFARIFGWIGRVLLYPVGALVYRLLTRIHRLFAWVFAQLHIQTSRVFTTKNVVHAAVVALVFFVTTSNIYASTNNSFVPTAQGQSVLSELFSDQQYELLIEEAEEIDPTHFQDSVSYLDDQAVIAPSVIDYDETGSVPAGSLVDIGAVSSEPSPVTTTPIEAVAAIPEERDIITQYTVKEGDSIASIATDFGVSITTILNTNGLTSRSIIRPGQTLTILPTDGVLYVVKKGDTLLSIAKKFQSDVDKVIDANALSDAGAISIGQRLVLPGGKLPQAAPVQQNPTRITTNIKDVLKPPPAADAKTSTTKLLWPTSARRITQYFKLKHTGVDIAGPVGTPIYASENGTIIYSGWNNGGYGNMIIVDHGNSLFTRYGHASKLLVKVGDSVQRGDTIALMGSTGRSTGPHLHYEVLLGNISRRVNPFDYTK